MAAQFFKRSFWYWERRHSAQNTEDEAEEEHGGGDEDEKVEEGQSSRKAVRSGIVVILAWMFSEPRNVTSFTHLYSQLGWDCLVCHSHPLNLHFPGMATTLALSILHELRKDLERLPSPVVFATFSGGHKTCLYKIIQILFGQCEGVNACKETFKIVESTLSGLIFDSSPVEFESSIGAKVLSQQVLTLKPGRSEAVISRAAHAVGRGLDFVFSKPLALQRRELWQALYSCVNVGPILILCAEEDELAPIETIHMFSANLCRLGGKVDVVAWKGSTHVGHFRRYPEQYSREVNRLLMTAISTYSDRCERHPTTWTKLPETIIAEIERMSKMPHLQLKKETAAELASPDGSIPSKDMLKESQDYGCRSRL